MENQKEGLKNWHIDQHDLFEYEMYVDNLNNNAKIQLAKRSRK